MPHSPLERGNVNRRRVCTPIGALTSWIARGQVGPFWMLTYKLPQHWSHRPDPALLGSLPPAGKAGCYPAAHGQVEQRRPQFRAQGGQYTEWIGADQSPAFAQPAG